MIRVLLADASSAMRQRLKRILAADPAFAVICEASDGVEALKLTLRYRPNLILMSARLPQMDGFETTRRIMTEAPTPIVVLSEGPDAEQVELSMNALRAGAVNVQRKPGAEKEPGAVDAARQFIMTLKAMANVKLVRRWPDRSHPSPTPPEGRIVHLPGRRIVAIGASTGGPVALQSIFSELPRDFPFPIVVVQHISAGFLTGFVNWLNTVSSVRVKIAEHGERLKPHTAYVASEDRHLGVSSRSTVVLSDAPPIGGFRPSASFLFESVAKAFGTGAINVILTGMGQDGLQGLRAAHDRGGYVLAQDEETSVVFGMPGAAIHAGLADAVAPLSRIASRLVEIAESERD